MNSIHDLQTPVWILVPEAIKDEIHVRCKVKSLLNRELAENDEIRLLLASSVNPSLINA